METIELKVTTTLVKKLQEKYNCTETITSIEVSEKEVKLSLSDGTVKELSFSTIKNLL